MRVLTDHYTSDTLKVVDVAALSNGSNAHVLVASIWQCLGNSYGNAGGQDANSHALKWYQKALDMLLQELGPEHPETICAMSLVAYYTSDLAKKEAKFWEALGACTHVLGLEHP